MNFRVWLKSSAADRVLTPIRESLIKLVAPDSSMLDIGCGTGDLLIRASGKISFGLGIDLDRQMIDFAKTRCRQQAISNLDFKYGDARHLEAVRFDYATATLCLHETGSETSRDILALMARSSRKILIADYTRAETLTSRLGIELDEMVSGHYLAFRRYRANGGIPALASHCGLTINQVIPSKIDGISIWMIDGNLAR